MFANEERKVDEVSRANEPRETSTRERLKIQVRRIEDPAVCMTASVSELITTT